LLKVEARGFDGTEGFTMAIQDKAMNTKKQTGRNPG
jgi:hypothetical protein